MLIEFMKTHTGRFDEAALELGRSAKSCKKKYDTMMLSLCEEGMQDFSNPDDLEDKSVPRNLRFRSIIEKESKTDIFSEAAMHGPIFHFSNVSPSNMDCLNQERYRRVLKT